MRRLILFALLCEFGTTENFYNDSAIVKDVPKKRQAPINDIISLDLDSPSDIHIKIIKENNVENPHKYSEEPMKFLKKYERLRDQELRQSRKHESHYIDDGSRRKVDDEVKFNHDDESGYSKQANDRTYEGVNRKNINVKLDDVSSSHHILSQKSEKISHQACKHINGYGDSHENSRNLINHSDDSESGKDLGGTRFSPNQAFKPLISDSFKQENLKNPIKHNDQESTGDHKLENEGILLVAIDNDTPIQVLKHYKALINQGLKPVNMDGHVYSTFVDANGKGIYGVQISDKDRGSNVGVNHDQIAKVRDNYVSVNHDQIDKNRDSDVRVDYDQIDKIRDSNVRVNHDQINKVREGSFSDVKAESNLLENNEERGNLKNIYSSNNVERNNFVGIVQENEIKNNKVGNGVNGKGGNQSGKSSSANTTTKKYKNIPGDNIDGIVDKNIDELSLIGGGEGNLNRDNFKDNTDFRSNFEDHVMNNSNFKDRTEDEYFSDGPIEQERPKNVHKNYMNVQTDYKKDSKDYENSFDELITLGGIENHTNILVANNGNVFNGKGRQVTNNYRKDFKGSNGDQINYDSGKSNFNNQDNQKDDSNDGTSLNYQGDKFHNDHHENQSNEQYNINNQKQHENHDHNYHDTSINEEDLEGSLNSHRDKFENEYHENQSNEQQNHANNDFSSNEEDLEDTANNQGYRLGNKIDGLFKNIQEMKLSDKNNMYYETGEQRSKFYGKNHQHENDFNHQESRKNSENPGEFGNRNNKLSKFSQKSFGNFEKDFGLQRDESNTGDQEMFNKEIRGSKFDEKNDEHENDLHYQGSEKDSENPGDMENKNNKASKYSKKSFENYEKDFDFQKDKLKTGDQESEKNSENPGDMENRNNKASKFSEKSFENYEKDFDLQRDKLNTGDQEKYHKDIQGSHHFLDKNNEITDNNLNDRVGSPFRKKKIDNTDEFVDNNKVGTYNRHQILMDAIRNRFRSTTGSYFEEKTEKISSENDGNVEFSPTKSSKPVCQDEAQAHCIKEEDKYFCKIGKSSYTIYTGSNSRVSLQVVEDYVKSMFMKYGEGDRCLDMSLEPGKNGPCLKSKMPVDTQQMSNFDRKSTPASKRGSLNIICTPIEPPPKSVNCRNGNEAAREVIYECRWRTPNKIFDGCS